MAQAGPRLSRRAAFSAALALPAAAIAATAPHDPVLDLDQRRTALQAELEVIDIEDEAGIGRLCDGMDALAARMATLPTITLQAARAKLRCIEDLYDVPFVQVLGWMDSTLEAGRG